MIVILITVTIINTIIINMRCPWCNGYCRRKWIRRHEFKSWTRLIAYHIALGKGMNPIISPFSYG